MMKLEEIQEEVESTTAGSKSVVDEGEEEKETPEAF
jgi:hypothetical protein